MKWGVVAGGMPQCDSNSQKCLLTITDNAKKNLLQDSEGTSDMKIA